MNRGYPIQVNNAHLLRRWRLDRGMGHRECAEKLKCSVATLYRIEQGVSQIPMHRINRIVSLTRGAIRYRDLIPNFHPEYA